jgi:hypothetical protein
MRLQPDARPRWACAGRARLAESPVDCLVRTLARESPRSQRFTNTPTPRGSEGGSLTTARTHWRSNETRGCKSIIGRDWQLGPPRAPYDSTGAFRLGGTAEESMR